MWNFLRALVRCEWYKRWDHGEPAIVTRHGSLLCVWCRVSFYFWFYPFLSLAQVHYTELVFPLTHSPCTFKINFWQFLACLCLLEARRTQSTFNWWTISKGTAQQWCNIRLQIVNNSSHAHRFLGIVKNLPLARNAWCNVLLCRLNMYGSETNRKQMRDHKADKQGDIYKGAVYKGIGRDWDVAQC